MDTRASMGIGLFMSYELQRRSHTAGEGDAGRGKRLQLRLELGNFVMGEGGVVVGDKTDTVWEGKPLC
jgi:hypothetical protein